METETASTATVEDGNGHIPSDVSMKEDLQTPRNCKPYRAPPFLHPHLTSVAFSQVRPLFHEVFWEWN